jgi:hypothetical protein
MATIRYELRVGLPAYYDQGRPAGYRRNLAVEAPVGGNGHHRNGN